MTALTSRRDGSATRRDRSAPPPAYRATPAAVAAPGVAGAEPPRDRLFLGRSPAHSDVAGVLGLPAASPPGSDGGTEGPAFAGTRPTLDIPCGLPFAGNTTLARRLAVPLGLRRVAIDDLIAERGERDGVTGLTPAQWSVVCAEAYRRAGALLIQGTSVADDSTNFTRELRDRLWAIATAHGARNVVEWVDVPAAEARRRRLANRETGEQDDVRDADFAQVVDYFQPPGPDGAPLRDDGSLPPGAWTDPTFAARPRGAPRRETRRGAGA